jgi:hypothetical protein
MVDNNSAYRHITFFKFKSDVTDQEKEEYERGMHEMLSNFKDVMKNVQFGKNLVEGFDYIINAEFNTLEDRTNYLNHDVHKKFFNQWVDRYENRTSGVFQIKF